MAKPKFKLGQLVEFKTDETFDRKVVVGILTEAEGYSYKMKNDDGTDLFVAETNVTKAYKELKGKKAKTVKVRAPRKTKTITTDPTQPTAMSS